jgi:microcystin-dependent protein
MLCDGTLLQIRSYNALYSLLGTQYGGDGQSTFGLPDLRGRFAVGQGISKSSGHVFTMGTKTTSESLVLAAKNMPPHTHSATYTTSTNVPSSAFSVTVASNASGQTSPNGNLLGQSSSSCNTYAPAPANPTPCLGGVTSTGGTYSSGIVSVQPAGGGTIPLFPPYQVLSYMICVTGYYPPRP